MRAREPTYKVLGLEDSFKKTRRQKCYKFVERKVPIVKWLPNYKRNYAFLDIIAGFTVWLTSIPASMGDASIAGLSPEFGLYSSYMGTFIYGILGSCKELIVGPQAVISLLTFQTCGAHHPECAVLLGFYSGVVHFILGVLHLGFLVSFISEPVTVGFITGASMMIVSGQLKSLLGISGPAQGTTLIKIWKQIIKDIETIRLYDSVLGCSCVFVLITLFKLKDISKFRRWEKPLRILSLCRNALVLIVCIVLGIIFYKNDIKTMPFRIIGNVPKGFPKLSLPRFDMIHPQDMMSSKGNNSTGEPQRMSFTDTLTYMSSAPLIVAFIGILQNVAMSKKFSDGKTRTDATQELICLGVVNLVGAGFFKAIPCGANFSRSAVNASSGVKSHVSGLISGVLMVLSIGFLTPYFKYIPKSSLAAIIISAVIFMIDVGTIIRLWKFSKLDLLCCVLTFLTSVLLGMEYGILIGVGFSILVILLKSLRPSIRTEYRLDNSSQLNYIFIRMDQGLSFPSVDYIHGQVIKRSSNKVLDTLDFSILVLECSMWTKWDYTTINAVVSLVDTVSKSEKIIVFYKLPEQWIDLLSTYGLENPILCRDMEELTSVLLELNHVFIGPQRRTLAGKSVSTISGLTQKVIPAARPTRESQLSNYNFVREKFTIKVQD